MKEGIVLFAFGKKGYVYMACNIALSIKYYNPSIHITLFIEEDLKDYLYDHSLFNDMQTLSNNDIYSDNIGLDPAKIKTSLYDYLPYEHNLYLDVDGIALKDLQPLMDSLKNSNEYFLTDIVDKGKKGDSIQYNIWSKNELIWQFFDLKEDSILPSLQTSWAYIKKCKKAKVFFDKVKSNFNKGFPIKYLLRKWGGTVPDELIYAGTMAQMNFIPENNIKPLFFGNKLSDENVESKYYILSIYGHSVGKPMTLPIYTKMYDNLGRNININAGKRFYNSSLFLKDKYANGKR